MDAVETVSATTNIPQFSEPASKAIPTESPTGGATIEAQQMVRRVKTYTILDSEFNSLAATTVVANLFLFLASACISIWADCLISTMATSPNVLSAQQQTFFEYVPKAALWIGVVFFVLTVCCWVFGYSTFRHIKNTSREGKLIA
jgi:hypothetical protein